MEFIKLNPSHNKWILNTIDILSTPGADTFNVSHETGEVEFYNVKKGDYNTKQIIELLAKIHNDKKYTNKERKFLNSLKPLWKYLNNIRWLIDDINSKYNDGDSVLMEDMQPITVSGKSYVRLSHNIIYNNGHSVCIFTQKGNPLKYSTILSKYEI